MSERVVHVYRVVSVAEHVVEDDGVYEDEVDLLRDVLEAARAGLLEFEPSEENFLAVTFDERNVMRVTPIVDASLTGRAPAPEREVETSPPPAPEPPNPVRVTPPASPRRRGRRST